MTAGYSATPLAQKLGYKPGMRAWFDSVPENIVAEIDPAAIGIDLQASPSAGLDAVHLFVTERVELERKVSALRDLLAPAGMLWISWPKQAVKIPTNITEDVVREIALPLGLVDVKVCAVDPVWSGLKLVIRRELR